MDVRWHIKTLLVKLAVRLLRLSGWYEGYYNHWREMFPYAEQQGLHIMPVHYYSPIPDTRSLPDALWQRHRTPAGIDLNLERAGERLLRLNEAYGSEYAALLEEPDEDPHRYFLKNSGYRSGDAQVLFGMLRDLKPGRIIEIGAGYSTLLISEVIRANRRADPAYRCEFVAIEPFPPPYLRPPPAEVDRLHDTPLQKVPLDFFASLRADDVLFIDSSHVSRIGSDVVYEYLEILPSLSPGVFVHIHDIFLPANYPREWIEAFRFFWNEQYLFEAFLAFNRQYEVVLPMHALCLQRQDLVRRAIPAFHPGRDRASSFWIRRRNPE
jgi:hypothetical protein